MTNSFQIYEVTRRLRDFDLPHFAADYEHRPSVRTEIINKAAFELVSSGRTADARELLKVAA